MKFFTRFSTSDTIVFINDKVDFVETSELKDSAKIEY
jgi:hypothetical protein